MPLVIVVLIIIVIAISSKDKIKSDALIKKHTDEATRKTNARLERELVDRYMKYGKNFKDAYWLARQDIVMAGFYPCIPETAYDHFQYTSTYDPRDNNGKYESSWCEKCEEKFDSSKVRWKRDKYLKQCYEQRVYPNRLQEYHYIYDNFDG